MNDSSTNKSGSRLLKLAFSLLIGLSLLTLIGTLSSASTLLTQAAKPHHPYPAPTVEAAANNKLFLPIVNRKLPSLEEQLLDLINAERQARGLKTLRSSIILMEVAEAHSQDMLNRDFFDHTNPDGLDPGDRLNSAGYKWNSWGEVIGVGYSTPQAMFNGWMNSPGHRAILLNPNHTEIGLGYVAGGTYSHYWTGLLATPQ